MPTLSNIHAYAPSTSTNCAQCHGSAAASFAIPAANFSIVGVPAKHVPVGTNPTCEYCHVGAGSSVAATPVKDGAKFSGSAMNHFGLTTCVSCHGPSVTSASFQGITKITVLPPTAPAGANSHIPSGTACETCHAGSMPVGLVPANATKTAPGTTFATPVPTTAMIHTGITSGCQTCHEGGNVWMDMANYPLNPAVVSSVASTQYLGFQTRPGPTASTYVILDKLHPTTGDCSSSGCHGTNINYFSGNVKPSNHIPTSTTATCANCHTTSDWSAMPTLTNIHAYAPSTSTNCAQCHGSAAASFAIPAANFSIVGVPAKHVPVGTNPTCEYCHVGAGSSVAATPVKDGAKFSGSAMNHFGLTTCVSCHGPSVTGASFQGITKITVMPPTSPMGVSSHIPSGTACETCHAGSMPVGLVPANATKTAPGTTFATPVPTTTMIHTPAPSACQNCHEGGNVWMDMTYYPISPNAVTGQSTTQYTGFQTRPGKAAGTYQILDAAHPTGDCINCHNNFNYFDNGFPPNHIPLLTPGNCSGCHKTTGDNSKYTMDHTLVTTACSTCHADSTDARFKGPFAWGTTTTPKLVQMTTPGAPHIPTTNSGALVECSGCHLSKTSFAGTIMKHSAIGDTNASATGNACDACHEVGFDKKFYGIQIQWVRPSSSHHICGNPGTPTAPNVTICPGPPAGGNNDNAGYGSDCLVGCHQHTSSKKFTPYAKVKPTTPKKQIQAAPVPTPTPAAGTVRRVLGGESPRMRIAGLPAAALGAGGKPDHATLIGQPCQTCHNGAAATGRGPAHPKTTAACGDCHSTMAWQPVQRIDHADVIGNCASCHNSAANGGKPATHPMSGNDCDRCHTTSAWKPAAFDHSQVMPGTCATCHNALQAPGKSAGHVVTTLSCDSCHYVLGWKPVKPPAIKAPAIKKPVPRAPPPRVRGATTAIPPT